MDQSRALGICNDVALKMKEGAGERLLSDVIVKPVSDALYGQTIQTLTCLLMLQEFISLYFSKDTNTHA